MPNNQQGFDLETLKTDPKMWMRLAMPSKNGAYMENVFKDKENPLEKNDQAAVETIQKLAAAGKLYIRDIGRSRHFHKVEKDGEKLKLGDQHEMKLSNNAPGLGLGILMRMSRAYFKWIGLERISNWFDERLQQRDAINKLEERYKEEYKSLTSEEKAELKALRKHEKDLEKLDIAKERANATKKKLDAIRGKETTETLEELEAMLARADQKEADNRSPEKQFARRALIDHEENLQKVDEARKNANEKKKTLDALRGKETTETLEQLEQMLSNANRRGNSLSDNARKGRKALRDYVKSLRELVKTENKAEGTKKKLYETLGAKTTETFEQLKERLGVSPEEVNERRALRRHVENLRKLAEAEKKAGVTKPKLDESRSENNPKDPKEVESPLSEAPNIEDKTNTMQPTLLGDQPVQNQIPVPPKLDVKLDQKQTESKQATGVKKTEPQKNDNKNHLIINGKEVTEKNVNEFPPHIVEAFKLIQQMTVEREANKQANQQTVQQNVEQQLNENQPNELDMGSINDVEEPEIENTDDQLKVPEGAQEQIVSNDPVQPTADEKIPDQEIDSPLKDGAELEPEKVNIQQRHEDQAQMNMQARLAAEKEAMDSVANWKDRLANTLFSNEGVRTAKTYYEMIKDGPDGQNLLAGTVCGLLSAAGDPESKKQIMEGLLSGKPLGSDYNNRINESVTAYNHAVEQIGKGNHEPMTKLITNAALELGRQASQETKLSAQHVMIGRMISNAMSLADQHGLRLKFNEEQWATIRGAFQLSQLAQKHHDAKQFLGKEPMDVTSKEGRGAVRDLLMGNAVENMLQVSKYHGQQVSDVQLLMGCGCLTVDSLTKMMSATRIRKEITGDQVQEIMEMPNGYHSAKMAKQLGEELLGIAQEVTDAHEKSKQMDRQMQNEPEKEQQIESMQLIQPV